MRTLVAHGCGSDPDSATNGAIGAHRTNDSRIGSPNHPIGFHLIDFRPGRPCRSCRRPIAHEPGRRIHRIHRIRLARDRRDVDVAGRSTTGHWIPAPTVRRRQWSPTVFLIRCDSDAGFLTGGVADAAASFQTRYRRFRRTGPVRCHRPIDRCRNGFHPSDCRLSCHRFENGSSPNRRSAVRHFGSRRQSGLPQPLPAPS